MSGYNVCIQTVQTCGECEFQWFVGPDLDFVRIAIGEWPKCAQLSLQGQDADRLLEALKQAVFERNVRRRAAEEGSNAEVSSNDQR